MKKYTPNDLQKTGFFLYNEIKGFEFGDVVNKKYKDGDTVTVLHGEQELIAKVLHNSGFGLTVRVLEIVK